MDAVCSNKVDIIRTIVEYVEGQGTRQRRSSLNQLGLRESAIIGQCTERPWKFKNSKTIELLNAVDYAGILQDFPFSHQTLITYKLSTVNQGYKVHLLLSVSEAIYFQFGNISPNLGVNY